MRRHGLLPGVLTFMLVLGLGRGALHAASVDDISKLRAQLIEQYLRGAPEARTVENYIKALRPEGSWPDVDYANKEPGSWLTHRHLSRLLAMAAAYYKPDHPLAGNAELRTAILKALGHWTEKDYVNPNWWYMQIGVPQTMAPILLLMGDAGRRQTLLAVGHHRAPSTDLVCLREDELDPRDRGGNLQRRKPVGPAPRGRSHLLLSYGQRV